MDSLLIYSCVGALAIAVTGLFFWLRKRFKNQIQASFAREENYKQILESIPDLVLVKGPGSKILWANTAFRTFYGMSMEDLKNIIDAPFNADHTALYIRDDTHVYSTGQVLDIPEEPVTRYDGEVHIFHTVKFPLFDRKNKVIMTAGVSRDITERKHQEAELTEQRSLMANASKLGALGEMAGNMAHEINNPLAIIDGRAKVLERLLDGPQMDKQKMLENIHSIQTTVQRIVKIITSLRSIARDGSKDDLVEITLGEILSHIMSICGEKFRMAGVQLIIQPEVEQHKLHCREIELGQVMLNLVSNALDACKNLDRPWVRIDAWVKDDSCFVSVTDSGSGIPALVRKQMFTPFFTTKAIGYGTGLGLSVSASIIKNHQGELSYDDENPNTSFVVRLPIRPQAPMSQDVQRVS